uniref:Galanin receptor type 1-like n=1 Tax=Saccoglossus kowalevskii TaxID=10224 RepID=A0ABM0MIK3_SACKO|nr:PREDICTED: galanin receptor type 1-like [Saccoglossus kowalevskii]
MTVDRYYVISRPIRSRHDRTPKMAIIVNVLIWIARLGVPYPMLKTFRTMRERNWVYPICKHMRLPTQTLYRPVWKRLLFKGVNGTKSETVRDTPFREACSADHCSFLLHVPIAMYFQVYKEGTMTICTELFPSVLSSTIYQAYSLVMLYLLPLFIIAICYAFILKQVWKVQSLIIYDDGLAKQTMNRKKKVTRTVLIVVLLFAVSWGPIQAVNSWLRFDMGNYPFESVPLAYFRIFCLCLAYSNSCVNPFVYAFTGNNFRRYFKRIFHITDGSKKFDKYHTTVVYSRHGNGRKVNNDARKPLEETSI